MEGSKIFKMIIFEGEEDQHRLVGVAVKGPDNANTGDVVSQPFLVLFSEDDDHMDIEELDRRRDPLITDRHKRQVSYL